MPIFSVGRVHLLDEEDPTPPCAGAERRPCSCVDRRSVGTLEEFDSGPGIEEPWLSHGTNHRVIDGEIARDVPGEAWFIEIADLDALLAFAAKNGPIRLVAAHENDDASGFPKIEVHEDYE